jgi:hypothetical protein
MLECAKIMQHLQHFRKTLIDLKKGVIRLYGICDSLLTSVSSWPKIASDEVFASVSFGEFMADGNC